MKDDDILKLLESKKQEGLSVILDRYGGLISYIVKNTGLSNEEDIAECVSDILYTVWRRIKNFDGTKASFKTWLVIVSRGCAINMLRKLKKLDGITSLDEMQELKFHSSTLDPLEDNSLIELLQALPPPDNDIFYRRFVLGESVGEISRLLEMTQDAVYKRIVRGKEKLKALMEKEGYCCG